MSSVKNKTPKVAAKAKKSVAVKSSKAGAKPTRSKTSELLGHAPALKMPVKLKPMLATLVDKPFDSEGWLYEVKWDGYRAVAFLNKGKVELLSRNDKSFNDKFYPVTQALSRWKINAILDGEIVVVGENGISSFGSLQNWRSEADGELMYYVFDILWYEGKDLTGLTLTERKEILAAVLPEDELIKASDYFTGAGTEFFEAARQLGLEGIIAKKADSKYHINDRSREWLKIKANKRQEMVIGGFTINDDTSKVFSSLLVGVYDGKRLHYTGKVGTGFNVEQQQELMRLFKPLIIEKAPFTEVPDVNKPSRFRPNPPHATVTWLKPKLVCEVSYAEMTSDGIMRHPSFEGLRVDKKASAVTQDKAVPVTKAVKEAEEGILRQRQGKDKITPKATLRQAQRPGKEAQRPGEEAQRAGEEMQRTNKEAQRVGKGTQRSANEAQRPAVPQMVTPRAKRERKTLLNPVDETQVRDINGHELKFSNLDKYYWPKEKITKRDLINYYYQVAPFILPYLKDRPQSMLRHPDGITGFSFYYKNVKGKAPGWVETYEYHSPADDQDREYLVAKDEASLLYMASLGCIEMNPWHSRVQSEDYPDWCIMDLDPGNNTFNQVIEAANVTKNVLDSMSIVSYPKTSGSTGIHIYIPLGAKYTYEESKEFARLVATLVHRELPRFTSIERAVKDREGKMYIDFLQNRPQATVSAPYSVRPKPGATVSMPLHWDEVKKGLKMTDFTIRNAMERVRALGDIFKPVLGKGVNLQKALKLFEKGKA